jgi:hypothetical protein
MQVKMSLQRAQIFKSLFEPTITSIWTEFEDLVHGNVGNPHIVLSVNCYHMGQVEKIRTPWVDDLSFGVDCDDGVAVNRRISITFIGIIPEG